MNRPLSHPLTLQEGAIAPDSVQEETLGTTAPGVASGDEDVFVPGSEDLAHEASDGMSRPAGGQPGAPVDGANKPPSVPPVDEPPAEGAVVVVVLFGVQFWFERILQACRPSICAPSSVTETVSAPLTRSHTELTVVEGCTTVVQLWFGKAVTNELQSAAAFGPVIVNWA